MSPVVPRLAAALLALALAAAACASASSESARDGHPQVVATVFPLAWMAEQVAPQADVTHLGARGQDPHGLELSPQERELLGTADVLLYMGDIDFQPQVERAVSSANGRVLAVVDTVDPSVLRTFAHDEHADGEGEARTEEDEHAEEGPIDPHIWFDAGAMAEVAAAIGAVFADADAANAAAYRANAETLRDQLVALDEEITALLTSDCAFDEVIVSHEAYGYLLEPHGVAQQGISGAGSHSEASPQRIAELTAEIRQEGIPAVLTEPVAGRTDAEAVAAEAGVDLIEIYSLDIVTDEQYEQGYVKLLRAQAQAAATALGCD